MMRNPINAIPFEAFYHGSWHWVNSLNIKNGCISVQLNYNGTLIAHTICEKNLRVRSRKACAHDCSEILQAGVDVCVLSKCPITQSSSQNLQQPMLSWVDAKIITIKREHNEGKCACLYTVVLSKNKAPVILDYESHRVPNEVVTINRIAILQKLKCAPTDDHFNSWTYSEDLTLQKKSKLLSGDVAAELSWLAVYSVLEQMEICVKFIQNQIVYHIVNYDECCNRISYITHDDEENEGNIKIICFRKFRDTLKPKIKAISHVVQEETVEPLMVSDKELTQYDDDSEVEILYGFVSLRRSKRRKLHPDRFTSYSQPNFNRKQKILSEEYLDEPVDMVQTIGNADEQDQTDSSDSDHKVKRNKMEAGDLVEWFPNDDDCGGTSRILDRAELSDEMAIKPLFEPREDVEIIDISDSDYDSESPKMATGKEMKDFSYYESPDRNHSYDVFDIDGLRMKRNKGIPPSLRKIYNYKGVNRKIYSNNGRRTLTTSQCKKLIERLLRELEPDVSNVSDRSKAKSVSNTVSNHSKADVVEQEEIPHTNHYVEEFADFKWDSNDEEEEKIDEHEELWKEMEASLTTLSLLDHKQRLDAEIGDHSSSCTDLTCSHVFKLDEQIGLICELCKYVCTEIKYITPPMMQNDGLFSSRDKFELEDLKTMGLCNLEADNSNQCNNDITKSYNNVWDSISDLKPKLHCHQKRAFEFIWKNIAGSLEPGKMNQSSEKMGGCVISHTPGSGKTLSVITFLVSYLKLYPNSRPLILAPNNAVHIWWKEFQKWGISTPVHIIHPFVSYKKEIWDSMAKPSYGSKPNVKMMHIVDCLSKIKQWRETPSVLCMSYPAFFCFTFKESKYEYRQFMADILIKSPGLLILDEGHNPRSTVSKLRKQLMKVNTDLRILLSGTLFQNNFEEYFNTLSLARPKFVDDVIRELEHRKPSNRKIGGRKINRKERLARKLFVEEIGQKIESEVEEERKQGFNLLNKTTSEFIDSHDGDASVDLPGLHIYTIMLKSTDIQTEILTKLQNSISDKRFHFELELLITVGSIHPWLVNTVVSVDDYFEKEELERIEKYKKNFSSGSKLKFLIELVHKASIRGERVLVFCHNIPPINFLVNLFYDIFGWVRGREVLVLQGDQELFERSRIMDKFNCETNDNKCKILIASTLACAEGISLTAASRVVLLDSEWNHAKTRQAIARAFRPGQKKMVYVYRLLALDTWEEDKYNSNEWKAWLSKMIFLGRFIDFKCSEAVRVIEDELLKEVVEEDRGQAVQMITKQDDAAPDVLDLASATDVVDLGSDVLDLAPPCLIDV